MAPCVAAYFLAPCNSPLILVLMAYNRLKSFRKFFLNTLWPSYRGKRAGRLVRERERVSIKQIAIVSTRKVGRPWFSAPLRSVTLRYAPLRSVTLCYAASTLRTVYKLLQPLQMQKGRFHRRLVYHLYLSRMSCPWLPKWMNCATLSSMLI